MTGEATMPDKPEKKDTPIAPPISIPKESKRGYGGAQQFMPVMPATPNSAPLEQPPSDSNDSKK